MEENTVLIVVKKYQKHVEIVTFVNGNEAGSKQHFSRSWWNKMKKTWTKNEQNFKEVKMY